MGLLFIVIDDLIKEKIESITKRIHKLSSIMYITPKGCIDKEIAYKISKEYEKLKYIKSEYKKIKETMDKLINL